MMDSLIRKDGLESDFEERAQEAFPEHLRRMRSAREAAGRAKLSYALFGLFLPALPLLALGILLGVLQPAIVEFVGRNMGANQSSMVTPENLGLVANGLFGAAAVLGAVGFVLGFMLGVGRCRELFFQAEKFEMDLRQALHNASETPSKAPASEAERPRAPLPLRRRIEGESDANPPAGPLRPRMAPPPRRPNGENDPDF